jgi:membrane fusion protein, multidrug efflux system
MSFPVMRTLCLAMLLGSALVLAGCGGDKKVAEPVRPAIAAQPVPLESLAIETYSGDVRARYQSMLAFRIGGKIETRRVNNGERVKKGDVLATLAPEDARLAVSSAEAAVASAAADVSLADAELERHRQLLEKNYISKALFDARANQQKAAQARLEQAQAQLQVARNQSQYTRLQADADGVITSVNADAGQVVAPGTPVMSLARSGELEVEIDVPESRYAEFKPGRPLILELWSEGGKRYSGKIREVGSEADPATRTYAVRVNFDQADDSVQLGMTARVFFTDANAAAAVLIPLSALHEKDGKTAAWVIDPATRKVSLREVRVGKYREDGVSIISGLIPSDWIVTAGVHKLVQGQVVNPIDRENRAVLP